MITTAPANTFLFGQDESDVCFLGVDNCRHWHANLRLNFFGNYLSSSMADLANAWVNHPRDLGSKLSIDRK
jgi:hypothetical protein